MLQRCSFALPHRRILAIIITAVTLISCADRPESWGVVVWAPEESEVETGTVVPVYDTSQLNKTHLIRVEPGKPAFDIDQWRLLTYRKKRDAESYAAEYASWTDVYARVGLDKLRVRESPDAESAQQYKLRSGEIVKITGRIDEPSTVGDYVGYWYEVLTEEGVRGYTFDEYLEIRTAEELATEETIDDSDEFLERFFGTVYRPDSYREMVRTGRYDLPRFLTSYGVFADEANRTIEIVTEDHYTKIEYDRIMRPNEDSYAFEGTSLILTVHPGNWFNMAYANEAGERYSKDFVYFPGDIETLATRELDRRQFVLEGLIEDGNTLESSAYGTLHIREDSTFEWESFDRLVPAIVSQDATGVGTVEFSLYLAEDAAVEYDGTVVFDFALDDSEVTVETVRFLYTFGGGGIRFTLVPESAVDEIVVRTSSPSSTILFFTFTSSDGVRASS